MTSDIVRHELRLYGHRGCSAHLPENTIEAFERALADGANALELDVHRTRDGYLVVSHDGHGLRTAGVASRIDQCSLEQVRGWDVGAGFVDGRGQRRFMDRSFRMPLLSEVLEHLPEVPLSVDLKQDDLAAVDAMLELLAAHRCEQRVTLASFHGRIVRALHRRRYSGRVALSRIEVAAILLLPAALARRVVRGHAAQIPVASGGLRLDARRFLRRCGQLGIRADYWVINDPEQAAELVRRGATGLMTDDPKLLAHAFTRPDRRNGDHA